MPLPPVFQIFHAGEVPKNRVYHGSKGRGHDENTLTVIIRHCSKSEEILVKTHRNNYNIHPGSTKMSWNLCQYYWWNSMKGDIAKHVVRYLTCQQVKAQHCKPGGLL